MNTTSSPLNTSQPRKQIIVLAMLALMLQIISGVPFLLALRVEVYLVTQVFLGATITRALLRRRLEIFEFVGLGFALGSLIAMCIDQLFVETVLAQHSWAIIPLFAVANVLIPRLRKVSMFSDQTQQINFPFYVFLLLAILVQERYWPLFIALSTIPLLIFNAHDYKLFRPRTRQSIQVALSVMVISITVYVVSRRPKLWWIKTQDFQFFEALSYSLTHWGSNDQVFIQGQPILYHWFSYAWLGLCSKAVGVPTWVMQTKIAPIAVSLAIICLVFALLNSLAIKGWQSSIVAIIFVLINDFNFESFSMVFSYVWLLGLAYFLILWSTSRNWQLVFPTSFMAAGAFGAKSSNIAVIVGGCGLLFISQIAQRRNRIIPTLTHGLAIALALGIVYFKLYFNSPYGATINLGTVGIAQDIFGDVDTLPRSQFLFWSVVILFNLVLVYVVAVVSLHSAVNPEVSSFSWFFAGTILSSNLALLIAVSFYEQEEYFLHSFVLFGSLIVGIAVCQFANLLKVEDIGKLLFKAALILLTSAASVRILLRDNNSGEHWAIQSRIANGSSIIVMFLVTILLRVVLQNRIKIRHLGLTLVACSSLVTAITSNYKWFSFQSQFRDEVSQTQFDKLMLGDLEIQEFLKNARTLLPKDAIVASNYECDNLKCPIDSIGADRVNWEVGGEAMLISIYLERRMFISGYGFLWQNVELPEFAKNRLRLSSQFGLTPTKELSIQLQRLGVNYYILDKSRSHQFSNALVHTLLLAGDRFELYSLNN